MTTTEKNAFQPCLETLDGRCLPSAGLVPRLHLAVHVPHHRAVAVEHRLVVHHHPAAFHPPHSHHFIHHRFVHHRVFVPVVGPFLSGAEFFPDDGFSALDFGDGSAVDSSGFDFGGDGGGDFGGDGGGDFGGDGGGDFGGDGGDGGDGGGC